MHSREGAVGSGEEQMLGVVLSNGFPMANMNLVGFTPSF